MARTDEMSGVMPSGDTPPVVEESGNVNTEEKVYAGKYKTPEELEAAYKEAESKIGTQGSEVGELRKNAEAQQSQIKSLQAEVAKSKAAVEPESPYEKQLADIVEQMEAGEIPIEQAILKSNELTATEVTEKAITQARAYVQKELKTKDAELVQKNFMDQNPDYADLQKSGTLEAIKKENPMHDDFSAYYAHKATEAEQKVLTETELAKKEAEDSKQVLKKPGSAIRQTNTKPLTNEKDMKAAMLNSLAEAKGEI